MPNAPRALAAPLLVLLAMCQPPPPVVLATPLSSAAPRLRRDDGMCSGDPEEAQSWVDSRAGTMVDGFIGTHGEDGWLKAMDSQYHLGGGQSDLNCDDIYTNHCPAPGGVCSDMQGAFWYVRNLASRVNEHFRFAHEKLQDSSIRSLALVDQMVEDFKGEIPQPSWFELVFKDLAFATTLTGSLYNLMGGPAGAIFGIFSSVISFAGGSSQMNVQDFDAIKTEAERQVASVLDAADDALERTLPSLWGDGDAEYRDRLWATLEAAGLGHAEEGRKSNVSKIFDGGELLVPVLESQIGDAFAAAMKNLTLSILGKILSGLQYMVVGVMMQSEDGCKLTYGAQWLQDSGADDEGCYYLVQRPSGKQKSETAEAEVMDKLVNDYGLDITPFFDNARRCDNSQDSPGGGGTMWLGEDGVNKYPPCFFSIAYVKYGGGLDYPLMGGGRSNSPPSWVGDNDGWNEPREKFCDVGNNKDFPACKTH